MHIQVRARNVAIKIRDMLLPACPTVMKANKPHKILPVCFIHNMDPRKPEVHYALPPTSKKIDIPSEMDGIKIVNKSWEGPAPKGIQDMALKVFGARKK